MILKTMPLITYNVEILDYDLKILSLQSKVS